MNMEYHLTNFTFRSCLNIPDLILVCRIIIILPRRSRDFNNKMSSTPVLANQRAKNYYVYSIMW